MRSFIGLITSFIYTGSHLVFFMFRKSYLNHIDKALKVKAYDKWIHQSSEIFDAKFVSAPLESNFPLSNRLVSTRKKALLLAQYWSTSTALWAGLAQSGGEATWHMMTQWGELDVSGIPTFPGEKRSRAKVFVVSPFVWGSEKITVWIKNGD